MDQVTTALPPGAQVFAVTVQLFNEQIPAVRLNAHIAEPFAELFPPSVAFPCA